MCLENNAEIIRFSVLSPYLHPNNSINEEQHKNQQSDIRQRLKGFDESPQQSPDAFAPGEQLYQPHHTEETKEVY